MIKAGIIGGSNPMAGELIRLLVNHPDVEIIWVDSARFTGRLVSDVHHGLLGETGLRISPSSGNLLDDINALFIFRHKGQTVEWLAEREIPVNLRIIDLSVDMRDRAAAEQWGFVYGLPELNRKAMVRGAKRAIVPHPAALLPELSLLPMAKAQALASSIKISISEPELGEKIDDADSILAEIKQALAELQPGFDCEIEMEEAPAGQDAGSERAMRCVVAFESGLDIGEIIMMYEAFYDDHNFTFIVNDAPDAKEVVGTNKCLMSIDKRGNVVTVTSVMDALIKGAAGTAVHDMNLLFGLHERVGLALKASIFI